MRVAAYAVTLLLWRSILAEFILPHVDEGALYHFLTERAS